MKYLLFFLLAFSIFAQEEQKEDLKLRIPIPFYSSDTGIGMSLYCKDIKYRDNYRKDNQIMAFITSKGQSQIFASNSIENIDTGINFNYGIGYVDWKSTYYGIGLNENNHLEEDYSKRSYQGHIGFGKEISARTSVNMNYIIVKNKIMDISENIISENRDDIISGINLTYFFYNTDDKRNPKNGYSLRVSGELYDESFGSDEDYNKWSLDAKVYKELDETNRLAFQYVLERASEDTPFYDLYSLGSSVIIRGFLADRYIDNNFTAFQGEYKHYLNDKWVAAIFAGAGSLSHEFSDIYSEKLKLAAGIGLRYVFSEKENVKFRFDIGFNDDGESAVYILFTEAI